MKDLTNESVIHVRKDGVQFLQFRKLLEYSDKIIHCYTLKPIDIKGKSKDDENYKMICNALELDYNNVVIPFQTHTNNVDIVLKDSESGEFPETDGLITNEKNKILCASFADCTSLYLYDPVKNAIGNIHSGWRGTVAKIGKVAVEKMTKEFGSNPEDLICCIGPTIRQCHFEVEDDVKNLYMDAFGDESIIKKADIVNGKQKYFIDSVAAITKMLKQCGLKSENIIDSGICTVCNNDVLHSYRSEWNLSGRNASIICLK
ncbi:MAG: peptidoglycan editing factor PgeF [Clostridia bacterium]|nr:peptidoglycan editing factor PgeF [Clostridia bacterium]